LNRRVVVADTSSTSETRCGESGFAISRSQIDAATVEVLNRGGWANPDVLLLELADGRRVVVKDYQPRGRLLRSTFGRWVLGREARAYRKLAGVRGVPALLGQVDPLALVIEYRPGRILSRSLAGELPEGFVTELHEMVGEMHARGVVHLDLRHRSNVLAGNDGHPVLIDFASAVFAHPDGVIARCLQRIDALALRKWKRKLSSDPGTR
jgi:predicted Ser/Thr protein kinase